MRGLLTFGKMMGPSNGGPGSSPPVISATWDAARKGANIILSADLLTATADGSASSAGQTVFATYSTSTQKVMWGIRLTEIDINVGQSTFFGIGNALAGTSGGVIGSTANGWCWAAPNTQFYNNNSPITTTFPGTTMGADNLFCMDPVTGKVWAAVNNTSWFGGGDPASGTSPTFTMNPGGVYTPAYSPSNNISNNSALLLSSPASLSAYTAPAGFQKGLF